MTGCQVGPKYCPDCGLELEPNASVCIFCGYDLKKMKIIRINSPTIKEEKLPIDEKTRKKRKVIGILICAITLPYITITSTIIYYPSLYFLFPILRYELLFIAFPAYLIGLGLIYFSIQTRYKGFFLMILGYFLFCISFLVLPPIDYYEFRLVILFLLFIDLPIFILVFLGIRMGFTRINDFSSYSLGFLPVVFSNFFVYIQIFTFLGY